MIKRGIPLILTYHLEGKNHLYLNSLHSMGTLHLREWFDSHQGLWYTPVLSPMLPLCRVESLSTFLGSIPFSVIGHSFNLNISEKLFVRNYQKKMRRARVLHLPKWSPSDKHTTPGGVLQHGTRFSLVGMDNRGTPISGEPSFLHFPGGEKKKATTAIPVGHNKRHPDNFSIPFTQKQPTGNRASWRHPPPPPPPTLIQGMRHQRKWASG